jgi:hypothetical protein
MLRQQEVQSEMVSAQKDHQDDQNSKPETELSQRLQKLEQIQSEMEQLLRPAPLTPYQTKLFYASWILCLVSTIAAAIYGISKYVDALAHPTTTIYQEEYEYAPALGFVICGPEIIQDRLSCSTFLAPESTYNYEPWSECDGSWQDVTPAVTGLLPTNWSCYSHDLPDIPIKSASQFGLRLMYETNYDIISLMMFYPLDGITGRYIPLTDMAIMYNTPWVYTGSMYYTYSGSTVYSYGYGGRTYSSNARNFLVDLQLSKRLFLNGSVEYQPEVSFVDQDCVRGEADGSGGSTDCAGFYYGSTYQGETDYRPVILIQQGPFLEPSIKSSSVLVVAEVLNYDLSTAAAFVWTVFSIFSGSIIALFFKTSPKDVPRWFNNPLEDVLNKMEKEDVDDINLPH